MIKLLMVGAPVTLVGAALIAGAFFFKQGSFKAYNVTFVDPTVSGSTQSAVLQSAQASQSANRKGYKIKIANGGGVKGEALKLKAILEKEGYRVTATGNADSFSYKETSVQAKSSTSLADKEDIAKTLAKHYIVKAGDDLQETAETDVFIIIGSEKATP